MAIVDPIADMLTRIRNGLIAGHETVDVPASKINLSIAKIMVDEGYLASADLVKEESDVQGTIHIALKYGANKQKAITGLKRISKPGLRVYAKADEIPSVLNGMGIAIVSTSKGVMTDKEARKQQAGGEILAYVW